MTILVLLPVIDGASCEHCKRLLISLEPHFGKLLEVDIFSYRERPFRCSKCFGITQCFSFISSDDLGENLMVIPAECFDLSSLTMSFEGLTPSESYFIIKEVSK